MNLPPLPWEPLLAGGPIWELINKWYDASAGDVATHAADQIDTAIRAYAEQYGRLCAEAEREACALIATRAASDYAATGDHDIEFSIQGVESAIRARGTR